MKSDDYGGAYHLLTVTMSIAGAISILPALGNALEEQRQASPDWLALVWPVELLIASIIASRVALRAGRFNLAASISLLPLAAYALASAAS